MFINNENRITRWTLKSIPHAKQNRFFQKIEITGDISFPELKSIPWFRPCISASGQDISLFDSLSGGSGLTERRAFFSQGRRNAVSISMQQHKILLQLEAGHRIHIVRSPLTHEPTFAVLIHPSEPSAVQYLPWWRIERLINTGHAHLSDPDRRVATEVLVSPAYAARRRRRKKQHP